MASNTSVFRNARRLLYLVAPDEECYAAIPEVPKMVDEAVPLMICTIAMEYIIALWLAQEKARTNDAVSSMISGGCERLLRVVISTGELAIYSWVFNNLRILTLPWQSHITWWLGFLGVDFGYYWFHRALHEINVLWVFHQVHHSSEDFNLTTALRKSVVQFYFQWIFYVPMALAIPPSIFFVHLQLNLLYQFWIHTELIGSLGPLDIILNTPSFHRVHHGRNPYCAYKNYGGTLIIWDRLFGTFQAEQDEKLVYGLSDPVNSWNPLYIQFLMIPTLWRRFYSTKGWRNKLYVLIKSPFWTPGSPWRGYEGSIPKVKYPVLKFDKTISRKRQCYVLMHLLMIFLCYKEFMSKAMTLNVMYPVGFLAFFLLTALSIGALFESRWYASSLEFSRCMLFILADLVLNAQEIDILVVPATLISVIRGVFILSAFTWMFVAWNDFNAMWKLDE